MPASTQFDDDARAQLEGERVSSKPKKRVLLADDNQAFIESVRKLLEPRFEVVGAVTDGQFVLREASTLNPDVIVLDVNMGEHNGMTVARQLQETAGHIKVVFLTIYEVGEYVRIALAAGGAAYVFKSRMQTDLIPAILAACSGRVYVSCRNPSDSR